MANQSKPLHRDNIPGSFPVPSSVTPISPNSQPGHDYPSFALPAITSTSNSSKPSQESPPNVHNFSPSPEKLIKMDFIDDPKHLNNTTLAEISRNQKEIIHFLNNMAHNVEQEKYLDSDASTISGGSMSSTSSRSSKRGKSRNLRRKRNKSKAKTFPMSSVREENEGNIPPQVAFPGTPHTPTRILQPSKRPPSPTPSEVNHRNHRQSFKEQLDRHFPAYVHPALEELGVSTVEQAYYLAIESAPIGSIVCRLV